MKTPEKHWRTHKKAKKRKLREEKRQKRVERLGLKSLRQNGIPRTITPQQEYPPREDEFLY